MTSLERIIYLVFDREDELLGAIDGFQPLASFDLAQLFSDYKELKTKMYYYEDSEMNTGVGLMKSFLKLKQGHSIYYQNNMSSRAFLVTKCSFLFDLLMPGALEMYFEKIETIEQADKLKENRY